MISTDSTTNTFYERRFNLSLAPLPDLLHAHERLLRHRLLHVAKLSLLLYAYGDISRFPSICAEMSTIFFSPCFANDRRKMSNYI